jgi:hypothetical protein
MPLPLFTVPRMRPSSRGQLLLAAIPLATMVITRALSQLEDLIESRIATLAGLDARIEAREAALGVLARYAPADPPAEPAASSTVRPEPTRCAARHPVPGTDVCQRDPGHEGAHIGEAAAWWDTVDVTAVDPDAGPVALAGCHECGAPATTESASGVPWCAEHVPARA